MTTQRIRITPPEKAASHTYDIRLGDGILGELAADLNRLTDSRRALILTDETVSSTYLKQVRSQLVAGEWEVYDAIITSEQVVCRPEVAFELWRMLAMHGLRGSDILIALGGSDIIKLGAFVAGTYSGGIGYIQIPTTLKAMVRSVGTGTAAIDLPEGRNLVSTQCQPTFVCADINTLTTIQTEQWDDGYAEIIRIAMVSGQDDWQWLASIIEDLARRDIASVQAAVQKAITCRARLLVEGKANFLEYGSFFAEALLDLKPDLEYNQALLEGMHFAAQLAIKVAGAPSAFARDTVNMFGELGIREIHAKYSVGLSDAGIYESILSQGLPVDSVGMVGGIVLGKAPGQMRSVAISRDLLKKYALYWLLARDRD